jgi:hypothetical protein
MDNKFTTVISYEKPLQNKPQSGRAMFSNDVGALLKALGFMALWLVFTAVLLAEPLMLNSNAARENQEHLNFTVDVTQVKLQNNVQKNAVKRAPHPMPTNLNAKLNAEPSSTELPPARLSYALLSVK